MKESIRDYTHEVSLVLEKSAKGIKKDRPKLIQKYMNSQLRFLGLPVPTQRRLSKKGFSFKTLPEKKQIAIWEHVWKTSKRFDDMSLSLFYFEQKRKEENFHRYWPVLKKWAHQIENWAHSDILSGLYARIHEQKPALTKKTFETWNRSKNPWLRRQSIVSLIYYHSAREKTPPAREVIQLLNPLIDDPDYYVQKGVGWTLRELGNAYPKAQMEFLKKNLTRLSSIAFSSATEKTNARVKSQLKLARKKSRQMKSL